MKQQGRTWYTADGSPTLAKYLPAYDRLTEKLGQKIVAEAKALETRLREAKAMFIELCKEALRNSPDKNVQVRHTFFTFDREFKIEYDIKSEYVRVYRATKKNPSFKDYELVNLDFNKSLISLIKMPDQPDFDAAIQACEEQEKEFEGMAFLTPAAAADQTSDEVISEMADVALAITRSPETPERPGITTQIEQPQP